MQHVQIDRAEIYIVHLAQHKVTRASSDTPRMSTLGSTAPPIDGFHPITVPLHELNSAETFYVDLLGASSFARSIAERSCVLARMLEGWPDVSRLVW